MLSTVNLNRKIVADGSLSLHYDFVNTRCYISGSSPMLDLTTYNNNTEVMQPYPAFTKTPGYSYFTFYSGSNQSVISGSIPIAFDPDNDLTFSFWLRGVDNPALPNHFLQIQNSSTDQTGYIIQTRRGGTWGVGLSETNSGGSIISQKAVNLISASFVLNGEWNNLAITINNKTVTGYLNGVSYPSVTYTGTIGGNNTHLVLGGTGTSTVYYLFGDLATFSIYTKALSSAEVIQNYDALKGRFGIF